MPVFADQFENGRRVAQSGAGLIVEMARDEHGGLRPVISEEDAPRIAKAVDDALGTAGYRRQVRHMAEEMAATLTVDEVLATLLTGASNGAR